MIWTVLVESPPESLAKEPGRRAGDWTLHPRFIKDGTDENVFWAVGLTHKHGSKLERCGIVGTSDNLQEEHECCKCGLLAPNFVVKAKNRKLESLRGTDPRNDRRGAILATRKKLST